MTLEALESEKVSFVAHTNLDGHPGFKIGLQEVDGRFFMYLGHFHYSGWTIVDVTEPEDPRVLRFIEGPENTMTKNIQVSNGLMIAGLERPMENYGPLDNPMDPSEPFTEGAYIFDIKSDPTDPELVGHYETGGLGTHRNYYNGGDFVYMIAWKDEVEKGMLTVVDVSDPSDPKEVGQWWWPGQHEDDKEDADFSFYAHGPAYTRGDRAYLAYGRVGPVILDISNPTNPELVTRLAMGDGFGSFLGTHSFIPLPDTELAALTTESISEESPLEGGEGLNYTALVDISDERPFGYPEGTTAVGPKVLSMVPSPTPESDMPYDNYHEKGGRFGPHNLHHYRDEAIRYKTNDYLIMTWFNAGLRIFDISDPLAPTEAGYWVAENPENKIGHRPSDALVSQFEEVVVDRRGYIYCSDPNHGLVILESDLLSSS